MKILWAIFTLTFCLALGLIFQTLGTDATLQTASALSCIEDTLEDEFDRSDIVFFGIVDSKQYEASPFSSKGPAKVTFEVIESFKGFSNDKIIIFSYEDPTWGFEYQPSEQIMIFADYDLFMGFQTDQLCTRTGLMPNDEMLGKLDLLKQKEIEQKIIPDWIKNNAKGWHEGEISDEQFIEGIDYLLEEKFITIYDWSQTNKNEQTPIPLWIKNIVNWWDNGLISESEFLNAIQFLVKTGAIKVELSVVFSNVNEVIDSLAYSGADVMMYSVSKNADPPAIFFTLLSNDNRVRLEHYFSSMDANQAAGDYEINLYSITKTSLDRKCPLYYFQKDKLIVSYYGIDESVLDPLDSFFGEPFAVGLPLLQNKCE